MNFNWKTYVQNYEDLRKAGINNEKKAKTHWEIHGKNEGRTYKIILTNTENYDSDKLRQNIISWNFNYYDDITFNIKSDHQIIIL